MAARCSPRHPRKLGQRFLRDRRLAYRITSSFCKKPMIVYEIGPGSGVFTQLLAEKCIVIGVDVDLEAVLCSKEKLETHASPILVLGDALRPPLVPERIDAIFGSIPYNITGPILSILAKYFQKPALLILQKEVADRLAAEPGTRNYGRITVLTRMVYRVALGDVIHPRKFTPPPKVYSRVVILEPWRKLDPIFLSCVEKLTSCLFSQRRRVSRKVVQKCIGHNAGLDVDVGEKRVYELSIEEIEMIARSTCMVEQGSENR